MIMLSASQFARIGARFEVYRLGSSFVVSNFSDAAGNPAVDKLVSKTVISLVVDAILVFLESI